MKPTVALKLALSFIFIALVGCDLPAAEPGPPGPRGPQGPPGIAGMNAPLPPTLSGSRLIARVIVAEDGAREFLGWFDNFRLEQCAFGEKLGDVRCWPIKGFASTSGNPWETFADPDCTLVLWGGSNPGDTYIMESTDRIWVKGPLYPKGLPTYTPTDAGCVYFQDTVYDGNTYPTFITSAAFVGATFPD